MKIVTIVGARPQFIKAAAVSRVLRRAHTELLLHTGQHYDANMSGVFFDELDIPRPDFNLGVGSGTHARQTAQMLVGIEDVLLSQKPDAVLVYGDTNSTLAGALAAAKLGIPVAHVEAGLRSFNRAMPEELNRVTTDHLSKWLFCPTQTAVKNCTVEGISGAVNVGDVMCDALRHYRETALAQYRGRETKNLRHILSNAGGFEAGWYLATIHRAENTDGEARLAAILAGLEALPLPVVFPVHPRTKPLVQMLASARGYRNVHFVEPVGYLAMLALTAGARKVITDSGGLQKEAYLLEVPCVTVRPETEWVETLVGGWNVLAGARTEDIVQKVTRVAPDPARHPDYYGDGHAAERIAAALK